MSNYTKATNFASKDSLPTGDANKIVKGTEIDNEFNAISGAISSKADIASPTFTGTPSAPTAAAGTNTTQVATTAFVIAERTNTSTLTNKTLTSPTITGGTITGITDLAVADGGTGVSTLAANNVLLGNGTSALQTVAPSTSGNVLTSNGTTWTSAALPPSLPGYSGQVFTSTGTFTVPSGITAVKVTVVGGGGNGGASNASGVGGGGGGGVAIRYVTGLTPADTVAVTVGGVAGTSSFGAFASATGGASVGTNSQTGGNGGTGSSGTYNITGGRGGNGAGGFSGNPGASGAGGGAGSSNGGDAIVFTLAGETAAAGQKGGSGLLGGRGGEGTSQLFSVGQAGSGFGNGGSGGFGNGGTQAGGAGQAGVVIVEW